MKTGIELIADERKRQIAVEGWTPEHDAEHDDGELGEAAMCYIGVTLNRFDDYSRMYREVPPMWPWDSQWWKPAPYPDKIRNLIKAGALIAAEIDRLQQIKVEEQNMEEVCGSCGHKAESHVQNIKGSFTCTEIRQYTTTGVIMEVTDRCPCVLEKQADAVDFHTCFGPFCCDDKIE